ncbi:MAG: hypothetical protein ACRYGM_10350 [Janthinobacterium lividum]
MSSDPLETVLRLRRRAVDEARQTLARAVATEANADAQARAAERSIETEAQRASDPAGGDDLVEAFATWLPGARLHASLARATQERLEADVACKRAELAGTRTGLEVIETLLRQRQNAAAQDLLRVMQRDLDEAAARTPRREAQPDTGREAQPDKGHEA